MKVKGRLDRSGLVEKRGRTLHKTAHNNRRSESDLRQHRRKKQRRCRTAYLPQKKQSIRRQLFNGWCAAQFFCRDLESAGDASFRRFRTVDLRCNRCSSCQVWSSGRSPMLAGTTLEDPWHIINQWLCGSGSTTKPQQSSHVPPWCPPPGPHSGVAPDVGHGM